MIMQRNNSQETFSVRTGGEKNIVQQCRISVINLDTFDPRNIPDALIY